MKKGGARYQISPWQMIWQDGNYYLIGVDEKSGIVKHYRVDKMLKILTENEARNGAELFRKFDSARFAATVDFPSFSITLVTRSTFASSLSI